MNKLTPLNLYLLGIMVIVETKWKENTVVPLRNRKRGKRRTSFENEQRGEKGTVFKNKQYDLNSSNYLNEKPS